MHLRACATDGVFVPTGDGPPAFLPARPINQADLAALTERMRRRVIRWFRLTRLLDTAAAGDMLTRENIGVSAGIASRPAPRPPRDHDMPPHRRTPADHGPLRITARVALVSARAGTILWLWRSLTAG